MNPIRLSDLAGRIRRTVDEAFGGQAFWVMADVSNHKFYPGKNHHYFDLVEKGPNGITAKLNAVAWFEGNRNIRAFERQTGQRFGNDIHVLVKVVVDFHVQYGLKLTLMDIDARFTLGQLEERRQATIQRLLTECPGLVWMEDGRMVSANRGLPLPGVVQRIAVVSSESSAGYADFMHSLEGNAHGYRFLVTPFFTRVQGTENADELAERLYTIAEGADSFDAIAVIRGGGSQTDFLLFDEYIVARAIAAMPIPVLTGLGHLKDTSLADLLCHTPHKTPTECAEAIVARNRRFEEEMERTGQQVLLQVQSLLARRQRLLNDLVNAVGRSTQKTIRQEGEALDRLRLRLAEKSGSRLKAEQSALSRWDGILRHRPLSLLREESLEIGRMRGMLQTGAAHLLREGRSELKNLETLVRMASPEEVLRRGFAIVRSQGRILSDTSDVATGDSLQVILKDSEIDTTVTSKKERHGKEFDV
jgi:exodeoxyribonuclease VII large subunit